MDIYDCSYNQFIPLSSISPHFHSYLYFHNGQQIYPNNQAELQSIISKSSPKPLLVVSKSAPKQNKGQNISKALSQNELSNHLTPIQLEMIGTHPQSLFQNKLFNFKYAIEREGLQVSKDREEQLRNQIVGEGNIWKQASLEELQLISKKYDKIIEKCFE